jgi:hypothetical protein
MRVVRLNRAMLQRRICAVVELLAFIYWASLTLNFFGLRTPLITDTEQVLRANMAIGSLSISLQQVLVFLVTVWAAFALSRFLRFLLEEDIYSIGTSREVFPKRFQRWFTTRCCYLDFSWG